MNASTHPDRQQLAAYVLGTLTEDLAERLEAHLQACPACEETIRGIDGLSDPLIKGLRRSPHKDAVSLGAVLPATGHTLKHLPTVDLPAAGRPPNLLGEYELLEKLGEGGMGVVFKAQHRRMKRLVAVKMMGQAALRSPAAVKRFYREVEAAAKLSHPNIVTAYDAGEHEGVHYLVIQYVEGNDLGAIVLQQGPLPVDQAVDCIIQAARGLQYAHAQGIVHRDIKPSNLLLDKEGTVKILDLGLARVADVANEPVRDRLTGMGDVMGTCDYMAPEQATDSHCADARADIYSLGCTLYRLLTGSAPYPRETLMQILVAHRDSPIPSLCDVHPGMPPQLDAVYRKMVAKKPEERYQSMTEVIAALEMCAGRRPAGAASHGDEPFTSLAAAKHRSFPQGTSPRGAVTVAKTELELLAKATLSQQAAGEETGKQPAGSQKFLPLARKKKMLAAGAGVALLALAGIVALGIIVRTSSGTLEIESDDANVQVAVKQGGEVVEVIDAQSGWKIALKSGQYELAPQGSTDHFQLDPDTVTVRRGDVIKVKLTLKRPKPPLAADGRNKEESAAAITYPKEGGKVAQKDRVDGHLRSKGGWPVVLVMPLVGNESWYAQPTVQKVEDGEFSVKARFGNVDTKAGTKFRIVIVVAKNRDASEKFKEGVKQQELPAGIPQSMFVTVVRE